MNKKYLALLFIVALSLGVFAGILTTAKASPPMSTAFHLESDQYSDDPKVVKTVGNLVLIKATSYHVILAGGSIEEGTITLNVFLRIDIQADEAYFSGSFVITANEGTIHGCVNAKIMDYSDPEGYVTQGTFAGGGDMKISGTLETPSGMMGPLVWDGISW